MWNEFLMRINTLYFVLNLNATYWLGCYWWYIIPLECNFLLFWNIPIWLGYFVCMSFYRIAMLCSALQHIECSLLVRILFLGYNPIGMWYSFSWKFLIWLGYLRQHISSSYWITILCVKLQHIECFLLVRILF